MSLIFRLIKGAPVTWLEGDNNLRYLETLAISASNNFSNWTGSALSQFAGTSSLALTASYALNAGTTIDTGSLISTASFNIFTSSYYQDSSSFDQRINSISFDSSSLVTTSSFNNFTSSYNTGSFSGSFIGSLEGTASWAENYNETDPIFTSKSGSLATTGSNTFIGDQTITGSLTITNNLNVLGSASITYISESTLNIGTNLITVNTFNPSIRFGGLAVIDSGSSPQVSGSILFDSQKDQFIFTHRSTPLTSSVFLLGPETYNNLGNETYLTQNRIPKGTGIEHLNDSNISDNGSIVSINSNTQITGSLNVSGSGRFTDGLSVTRSLSVTGSEPTMFSSTGDILEMSGSFILYGSASIYDSVVIEGVTNIKNNTNITGLLNVSGSGRFTNGVNITGSLIITGSESTMFSSTGDVLEVSGSFILFGSASISNAVLIEGPVNIKNNTTITGSLDVSGSARITNVLTLPYQDPLPSSPATGSIALSGSGATFVGMFVWTGAWNQI